MLTVFFLITTMTYFLEECWAQNLQVCELFFKFIIIPDITYQRLYLIHSSVSFEADCKDFLLSEDVLLQVCIFYKHPFYIYVFLIVFL